MHRTETVKKVLALLEKERTTAQVRDALGISHGMAYQAIKRLERKGKIQKRIDSEGDTYWWQA